MKNKLINKEHSSYKLNGEKMEDENYELPDQYESEGIKFEVEREFNDNTKNIIELLYDLFEEIQKG